MKVCIMLRCHLHMKIKNLWEIEKVKKNVKKWENRMD